MIGYTIPSYGAHGIKRRIQTTLCQPIVQHAKVHTRTTCADLYTSFYRTRGRGRGGRERGREREQGEKTQNKNGTDFGPWLLVEAGEPRLDWHNGYGLKPLKKKTVISPPSQEERLLSNLKGIQIQGSVRKRSTEFDFFGHCRLTRF